VQARKATVLLTTGVWIGIFIVGLWPFNFIPTNRIRWLPNGEGMHFDRYGQVYSRVPVFLPAARSGAAGTIELAFTPSKPYHSASAVLSIVKDNKVTLAIGQSLTDVYLQALVIQNTSGPTKRLYIDRACERPNELFLTVTLDTNVVGVYIDGQLVRSFPVSIQADNLSGIVVLGHAVTSSPPWSGAIARVAILDGALGVADIDHRYQQWIRNRHLEPTASHWGPEYEFAAPTTGVVPNITHVGPDLIIPKTFRPLASTVLEWPDYINRSVIMDAIINVVGFIPFGLTTCLCIRSWTKWSFSRCVLTTLLVGASVSLAIEVLQVLLPSRDSSLADVVTNIAGSAIGAAMAVTQRTVRLH
jgi:hypothetical protein